MANGKEDLILCLIEILFTRETKVEHNIKGLTIIIDIIYSFIQIEIRVLCARSYDIS